MKDDYRSRAWVQAIQQHKPLRNPPEHVTLHAMFLMCRRMRDEDNLKGSLKFPCDTLRQKQSGAIKWRQGICPTFGYLIDDSPEHMTLGDVWQERCGSRDMEELIVEIIG